MQPTAVGDVLRKRRWLALAVMWWLTGSHPPESKKDIEFYFNYASTLQGASAPPSPTPPRDSMTNCVESKCITLHNDNGIDVFLRSPGPGIVGVVEVVLPDETRQLTRCWDEYSSELETLWVGGEG